MYRGIIVLFMLEGHVLRELLTPDLKATQFFAFHEVFHGVTAPGFLFGAGFTFAIATQRRWEESITFSRGFFRRMGRALLLILIGYALHIPFLSLQKTLATATRAQWNAFFIFDVLQCIGLCLLLMRLLLVTLRQERLFIATLFTLMVTVVYITPLYWIVDAQQGLPQMVSSAISGLTGSPFPLLPYAGFLIAGTCVSWLFLRLGQDVDQELFMKRAMLVGVLLIIVTVFLDVLPFQTYSHGSFWSTSPNYFWIRLGILLFMLGLLWYLEDFFSSYGGSIAWMPKWLTILGVESLFVYIAHLLILCGWVTNTDENLRGWWGGKLGLLEAVLVFLGLTLFLIPFSFLWRYLKKNHIRFMRGLYWWMGFCVAWSFLFNPY
jgi:hypothetical protein